MLKLSRSPTNIWSPGTSSPRTADLIFVMTPFYDHHADTNALNLLRMHSHQVHGMWNGTAVLDDGTKLEIKDMYAFCEYVENKW